MDEDKIRRVVEAALFAADGPLTVNDLSKLFAKGELDAEDGRKQIRDALKALEQDNETRGVELKRVSSGYRFQVPQHLSEWISRLWDERPPRYTRALLETLAMIAYKQPVTRGDIEQVRGVSVSQSIMRTLTERDWIRVVGQREVPGHPALYGTTRAFLDYFNLKRLEDLPPLEEIRELIEPLAEELDAAAPAEDGEVRDPEVSAVEVEADQEAQADKRAQADQEIESATGEALVEVDLAEAPQTAEVVQLPVGQNTSKPGS